MTAGGTPSRVRGASAFFLVFFPAVYLLFLGAGALIEPDEARYGEIPREMLESGDFLTPRLNYVKYFEKPPLFYWLNAASLALSGRNEYAVRLPTSIMALAGIALTGLLARKLFGARAGLLSAVVLGSAGGYLTLGQLAVIDMTLTFFLTAGLALLLLAALGEGKSCARGAALFLGLAVLAKGPVAVVLTAVVLAGYFLLTRDRGLFRRVVSGPAVLIFAAVTVPWFLLVGLKNREFLGFFFYHEHLQRFFASSARKAFHAEPFWFFFPVLLALIFPWLTCVPAAVREVFRGDSPGARKPLAFLTAWWAGILFFFSISSSKLIPYVLPCLPPLAVCLGWGIDRVLARGDGKSGVVALRAAAVLFALIGLGLGGYRLLAPDPLLSPAACFLPGGAALLGGAAVWAAGRRASLFSFCLLGAVSAAVVSPGLALVRSSLEDLRSTKPLARKALSLRRNREPFYSFNFYAQGFPFYAGERLVLVDSLGELRFGAYRGTEENRRWFIPGTRLQRKMAGSEEVFVVFEVEDEDSMRWISRGDMEIVARTKGYLLARNRLSPETSEEEVETE